MLVHTPTPMGKILGDEPGSLQLLGAGRRASTLRSRVRAVRRYLTWLALNHDVGYPRELEHVTGNLQARQTEPCTSNALRGAHTATAFMEEVSGVEQASKFTASQVYSIIQREILANTLPGKPAKQAPRMLVMMLSMLEDVVVNVASPVCHRTFAWWILVQSWGTLRFDDHRGIKPEDVSFIGGSMSALLTRSKTLGSDRAVNSRRVYVNSCSSFQKREWLEEGWRVLRTAADHERDYLLTAPSTNCNGCLRAELRYDSAFAIQNRVLHSLQKEENSVFSKVSTTFWTPHSARAFMPSNTKALGVPKEERDYLGGWSARDSDVWQSVSYPTFNGSSSAH